MRDDRFEWDDRKAATNLRKHRVAFGLARAVFDDPNALEDLDGTAEEERVTRLGLADGRLLFVVYTLRDQCVRIISARKAKRDEERLYVGRTS